MMLLLAENRSIRIPRSIRIEFWLIRWNADNFDDEKVDLTETRSRSTERRRAMDTILRVVCCIETASLRLALASILLSRNRIYHPETDRNLCYGHIFRQGQFWRRSWNCKWIHSAIMMLNRRPADFLRQEKDSKINSVKIKEYMAPCKQSKHTLDY